MALRRLDTKTAAVKHSIYLSVVFRQLFKTKVYLGIDMGLRQSHRRYPKPQNQGLHPLISQEHSYTNQTGRHQRNEIDKKTLVKNFPKRLPPIGPLAGRLANKHGIFFCAHVFLSAYHHALICADGTASPPLPARHRCRAALRPAWSSPGRAGHSSALPFLPAAGASALPLRRKRRRPQRTSGSSELTTLLSPTAKAFT